MERILRISKDLYERLQATVRRRGFRDIGQLLEEWQAQEEQILDRRDAVSRINALRERLTATYGEMPDSAELIREDRER